MWIGRRNSRLVCSWKVDIWTVELCKMWNEHGNVHVLIMRVTFVAVMWRRSRRSQRLIGNTKIGRTGENEPNLQFKIRPGSLPVLNAEFVLILPDFCGFCWHGCWVVLNYQQLALPGAISSAQYVVCTIMVVFHMVFRRPENLLYDMNSQNSHTRLIPRVVHSVMHQIYLILYCKHEFAGVSVFDHAIYSLAYPHCWQCGPVVEWISSKWLLQSKSRRIFGIASWTTWHCCEWNLAKFITNDALVIHQDDLWPIYNMYGFWLW